MALRILTLCLVVAAAFDGITDHPDRKKAEVADGGSVLGNMFEVLEQSRRFTNLGASIVGLHAKPPIVCAYDMNHTYM